MTEENRIPTPTPEPDAPAATDDQGAPLYVEDAADEQEAAPDRLELLESAVQAQGFAIEALGNGLSMLQDELEELGASSSAPSSAPAPRPSEVPGLIDALEELPDDRDACTRCGAELTEDDETCPRCGRPLTLPDVSA